MINPITLDFVREKIQDIGTAEQVRSNRIRITTMPGRVRDAIKSVQELLSCDRLLTISAADNGKTLELIYHLTGPHRMVISIALELSRDAPEVPTTSDILPPSGIYERQIHDLFGILFQGRSDLKKIILNEDWPENEYPLRKDWTPDPDTFYGGIKGEKM
jgi:NADH:ubiquinone oxidoreductase subunit C